MRRVSSEFAEKLESTVQTIAENANPATYLRIQRQHVPFTEKQFLERTKVRHASGITDSDVAVGHPKFEKDDETVWVTFIRNGVIHVKYAEIEELLKQTSWRDYWFTANASACAIAFDSVVKHDKRGDVWEFVTDEVPWIFWVDDGALKAKLCTPLGEYIHTLAVANVTDVSAVRGPSGEYGNWNLGLTVFFVMNGDLYYRQLIDGEWYDAEQVTNYVAQHLHITKIKAFNTWDHRVGVQILTDNNKLYELYSFTEGIGTRGTEHIGLDLFVDGGLKKIGYSDGYSTEHISFGVTAEGSFTYGLSAIPVSAINVEDDNNWGTKVTVTMDYPVTGGDESEFLLTDSNGIEYLCEGVETDGTNIILTFMDFNLAARASSVTVSYSGETLLSPATTTDDFEVTFTPVHLVAPQVDPPEFYSASVNSEGMVITLVMTEPITNVLASDIEDHFSISLIEYNYTPGGSLEGTTRTLASIVKDTDTTKLIMTLNTPNVSSAIGNITIDYDGHGGLRGDGGPVQAFTNAFTPSGLTWKGHHMEYEHLDMDLDADGDLIKVYYHDTAEKEHLELAVTGTGILTYIGDL